MLKHKRLVSIIATIAFCLSFLAPALLAPAPAFAAATYTALSTPILIANSAAAQNLGIIQVDIPSAAAVKAGDVLTVSLGSEILMKNAGGATITTPAPAPALDVPAGVSPLTGVEVFVPRNIGTANNGLTSAMAGATAVVTGTKTALDITFGAAGTTDAGRMLIYIEGVTIGSVDGDITAKMLAPANSAFNSGGVVVGKASSASGVTYATVSSVKTIGNAGGACDIISVSESIPNTLKAGETIKVKLPNGFTWAPVGAGSNSWGWATAGLNVNRDLTDPRILNVTFVAPGFPSVVGGLSGRANFACGIVVDDTVAKTGDIEARIYSDLGNVTETDLVIAKYGTFGVTITEGTKKDLTAGKYDQKIGEFYIAEDIANSLINGRAIKLTLPKGVKWSGSYSPGAGNTLPAGPITAESGNATLGGYTIAENNTTLKTIVTQVAAPAVPSKSKFKFKDLRVDVAPDFEGPVTITVSGDASAAGEVVVAEVKPAVAISAEDVKDVKIGEQDQALGTIILKESVKESVALNVVAIDTWDQAATIGAVSGASINLTLPTGARWSAGYPTVEVTEGDLELKTNQISKNGRVLTIPVDSTSTKPSTIKISGLKATLDRTVPEGDFSVAVAGTAINETGGIDPVGGVIAYAFPQFEQNEAIVANCVTPSPAEQGRNASFYIGSTIMNVNGSNIIMDAAPYIKAGRTYVPVRYLGDALGATTAWDADTKTVTVTKGDNTVVLVIGSTVAKVNGADVQMDVAPEITGVGRTMLPARWVAEGLGYQVGWNATLQQVVIQ